MTAEEPTRETAEEATERETTDEESAGGAPADGAFEGPEAFRVAETFEDVRTHAELVDRSAAYCERAVAEYGVDADLGRVDWEVSTRAKRRAAAVKRPRVPGAEVGRPIDWSAFDAESFGTTDGTAGTAGETTAARVIESPIPRCTVSLTWAAFHEFTAAEWASTLRHELIHVEQFQAFGTAGHGRRFERRAAELDTEVRCRAFGTPKYRLRCDGCGDTVARRYRECKLVRNHRSYVSGCCGEPLRCERPGEPE